MTDDKLGSLALFSGGIST